MSIRVLVVDDSALMRQMISRFLAEAGMDVVATAKDGVEGLEKAIALRPDVVTLDVEMPRMDGLTMLARLMDEAPLPVVMVSSVTQRQAPATIEALMLGAVDVVAKPGGSISVNLGDVKEELVSKVRAAARAQVRPRRGRLRSDGSTTRLSGAAAAAVDGRAGAPQAEDKPRRQPGTAPGPGPVVIGSSTGGPSALSTVLSGLSADFPRPVVVVQHMPEGFTASLARRLDGLSPLKVAEAEPGRLPKPGEAWIAKGGQHLVFDAQGRMQLSSAAPHLGVRPAVDLTLESAVDVWGGDVVAVILTGMGMDGARGARKLKRAGGKVLAQDEASSVVYGMPRVVTELQLADEVHSLADMAAALTRIVQEPAHL